MMINLCILYYGISTYIHDHRPLGGAALIILYCTILDDAISII